MRAIICNEFGPFDNLEFGEIPGPTPTKDQVVIRNTAIGINYPDGLLVQGMYQVKPPFPFVPGIEAVGNIIAVGDNVTKFKEGDKVAAVLQIGSDAGTYCEETVVNASQLVSLPPEISDGDGCALICAYGTAHHALKQRAHLKEGEKLVVLGAAGATGLAAVEIGKAMGAEVYACASTEEKLQLAKSRGADHLLNYKENNLQESLKQMTKPGGIDVAFDPIGGGAFNACTRCMAWNGRLLVVGFASGKIPKFPVNLALVKGFGVLGVFWGSFAKRQPSDFAQNMKELFQWYQKGEVKPHLDSIMPLEDAPKALAKVLGRKVMGKIILKP
jgi:NADPH2:quinone reductase